MFARRGLFPSLLSETLTKRAVKRGFGSSALIVVIVVMIFTVMVPFVILIVVVMRAAAIMIPIPIILVVAMVFVPSAMQSTVMMSITVVISIAVTITIPIAVMIAIVFPIPIRVAAAAWAAIPRSGTPRSAAARRYVAVRSARWNPVMLVDILHSAFHATDFTLVVGGLVVLPTGIIAVKPLLIAQGKPNLGLGEMRQNQRRKHRHECKQLLH